MSQETLATPEVKKPEFEFWFLNDSGLCANSNIKHIREYRPDLFDKSAFKHFLTAEEMFAELMHRISKREKQPSAIFIDHNLTADLPKGTTTSFRTGSSVLTAVKGLFENYKINRILLIANSQLDNSNQFGADLAFNSINTSAEIKVRLNQVFQEVDKRQPKSIFSRFFRR